MIEIKGKRFIFLRAFAEVMKDSHGHPDQYDHIVYGKGDIMRPEYGCKQVRYYTNDAFHCYLYTSHYLCLLTLK